jgi:hypothetical protein
LFQILLLRCLKVLFGHPRRFDRPPRAARVASNLLREILLLSCANIALWLLMLRLRLRFRTMVFWFRTVVVQLPVLVGLRLCVLLILGLDGCLLRYLSVRRRYGSHRLPSGLGLHVLQRSCRLRHPVGRLVLGMGLLVVLVRS